MSQVPVWVKAIDGKFYKDPELRGEGWCLVFDDDDPPEFRLTGTGHNGLKLSGLRRRAYGILNSLKIVWTPVSGQGKRFSIRITSPIPVPQNHDGAVKLEGDIPGECTVYTMPEVYYPIPERHTRSKGGDL